MAMQRWLAPPLRVTRALACNTARPIDTTLLVLAQETLMAAWPALGRFEGRSCLRSWLYRIATNRCLNHLRDRGRRLPELSAPIEPVPQSPLPTRLSEPVWLEAYPDVLLEGVADRVEELPQQ